MVSSKLSSVLSVGFVSGTGETHDILSACLSIYNLRRFKTKTFNISKLLSKEMVVGEDPLAVTLRNEFEFQVSVIFWVERGFSLACAYFVALKVRSMSNGT